MLRNGIPAAAFLPQAPRQPPSSEITLVLLKAKMRIPTLAFFGRIDILGLKLKTFIMLYFDNEALIDNSVS